MKWFIQLSVVNVFMWKAGPNNITSKIVAIKISAKEIQTVARGWKADLITCASIKPAKPISATVIVKLPFGESHIKKYHVFGLIGWWCTAANLKKTPTNSAIKYGMYNNNPKATHRLSKSLYCQWIKRPATIKRINSTPSLNNEPNDKCQSKLPIAEKRLKTNKSKIHKNLPSTPNIAWLLHHAYKCASKAAPHVPPEIDIWPTNTGNLVSVDEFNGCPWKISFSKMNSINHKPIKPTGQYQPVSKLPLSPPPLKSICGIFKWDFDNFLPSPLPTCAGFTLDGSPKSAKPKLSSSAANASSSST